MPISLTTCLILVGTLKNILHYFLWLAWAWPGTEACVITGCDYAFGGFNQYSAHPANFFSWRLRLKKAPCQRETLKCSCKLVQWKDDLALFLDQPDTEKWYRRFVMYIDATSLGGRKVLKKTALSTQGSKVQNMRIHIRSFHYHVHFQIKDILLWSQQLVLF